MTGLRWVRLDATFPGNPKIVALIAAGRHRAVVAYISSLAYSGHQGTDGHITPSVLPLIHATRHTAAQLVTAGLWHTNGNGWTIHDWHDYQPRTVEDISAAARRAANIRWHGTPTP